MNAASASPEAAMTLGLNSRDYATDIVEVRQMSNKYMKQYQCILYILRFSKLETLNRVLGMLQRMPISLI